jgi:hypothetical protein
VYESTTADVSEADRLLATHTAASDRSLQVSGAAGSTRYYAVYTYNSSQAGTRSNIVAVTYPEALGSWTLTLDGGQSSMEYYFNDIASVNDNCAFVCGYVGVRDTGLVLRWNETGGKWTRMALPRGVLSVDGLHCLSPTEVYATALRVEASEWHRAVLRYDGIAWTVLAEMPAGRSESLRRKDIHAVSNDDFFVAWSAVGYGGNIYRITDGQWTFQGIKGDVLAFADESRGYVGSSGYGQGIYRFNGMGWTKLALDDGHNNPAVSREGTLYCLKGSSSTDSLVVFSGDAVRRRLVTPVGIATWLFAFDDRHVWIGGEKGIGTACLALYDGVSVRAVGVPDVWEIDRLHFHAPKGGWALSRQKIYAYR